jgi:hypothetical protein
MLDDAQRSAVTKFLLEFGSSKNYDVHSSLFVNNAYTAATGSFMFVLPTYTKREESPSVYKPLYDLPRTGTTLRLAKMRSFTDEIATLASQGERAATGSFTVTMDGVAPFLEAFASLFNATLDSGVKDIPGVALSYNLQPQPQKLLSRAEAMGGNGLGMENAGNLLNVMVLGSWESTEDDHALQSTVRNMIEKGLEEAKRIGVWYPFVNMNYAGVFQNPAGGYGSGSEELMRMVSKEVDPNRLFQTQVSSAFKLSSYEQNTEDNMSIKDEL